MKHFLISSMLMLCGMGCWAQNSKDSVCVFDGTVTGVPDGSVVFLSLPVHERPGVYRSDSITTVKGGKFHFEKVIPAGDDCSVSIGRFGTGVKIKLNPGMKTVITGNGMDAGEWIAANDHPDQKEAKRINEQKKTFGPKCFSVMSEFLKNREFSPSYELELAMIAQYAYYAEDEEKMNICRELFAKVPKDYMSQNIYFVKKYLYPPFKPLKAGDKAKDYTLNDHDGKPHSILETLGKGKYLLLETARKACTGEILDRPKEYLKELHKKYADKFDVVTLAICQKAIFDDKSFPREDWLELGLNETSPFEEIQGTYFPREERFIFISPEGKILAKCRPDKLNEELKKNFPFIVE